jgi:hypothetical protein
MMQSNQCPVSLETAQLLALSFADNSLLFGMLEPSAKKNNTCRIASGFM